MSIRPESAEEVAEAVRAHDRVAARGGGTKAALIGEGEVLEMAGVAGITRYEPSEDTFTAKAGTAVKEVKEALKTKGQYLPFDPLFAGAGATLGGTVAAGSSGPRRFRYGGLRDFLIGVQFVDGCGKLVRSGGKVVKNAAGFDLPKFLVGSCGRYGIMTELSFKVFPRPEATVVLRVTCENHEAAVERLAEIACSRWEAEALDYSPSNKELWVRLGGPQEALELLSGDIERHWPGQVTRMDPGGQAGVEGATGEFSWTEADHLVKVPLTPSCLLDLERRIERFDGASSWYSAGGAVAFVGIKAAQVRDFDLALEKAGLRGLLLRGEASGGPWLGARDAAAIHGAVKKALDPEGRFGCFR